MQPRITYSITIPARLTKGIMGGYHCRLAIMCAVDSRTCKMTTCNGFKLYVGGVLPMYSTNTLHIVITMNKLGDDLVGEMSASMTLQYGSTRRSMRLTGSFVSVQIDLIITRNTYTYIHTFSLLGRINPNGKE